MLQAGLYIIHLCRIWSKIRSLSISRFAIFALSISISSHAVCLSFLINKKKNRLSTFMPIHILVFCVTSFFFVSSLFLRSIFVMAITKAITPYCFCINLALLPQTFIQTSLSFNFYTFSIFVLYITTFSLDRVCVARNFVVVILFFMKYASILFATSSGAWFVICFV